MEAQFSVGFRLVREAHDRVGDAGTLIAADRSDVGLEVTSYMFRVTHPVTGPCRCSRSQLTKIHVHTFPFVVHHIRLQD
jgi:hypothetical protein